MSQDSYKFMALTDGNESHYSTEDREIIYGLCEYYQLLKEYSAYRISQSVSELVTDFHSFRTRNLKRPKCLILAGLRKKERIIHIISIYMRILKCLFLELQYLVVIK